jgi:hypothetical protein
MGRRQVAISRVSQQSSKPDMCLSSALVISASMQGSTLIEASASRSSAKGRTS